MELESRYGVREEERSRVRPLGDLERPRDRGSGWRVAIVEVNFKMVREKRRREGERGEGRGESK